MPTATDPATIFCPKCRYNLTGLTRDVCPECGEAFDAAALRERLLHPQPIVASPWRLLIAPALVFVAPIAAVVTPWDLGPMTIFFLGVASLITAFFTSLRLAMAPRDWVDFSVTFPGVGLFIGLMFLELVGIGIAFFAGFWVLFAVGLINLC